MLNLMSEDLSEGTVAFEVCEAFRATIEHDEPVCASCGHLADDHARRERDDAAVTRLPRRPVHRPAPARRAS